MRQSWGLTSMCLVGLGFLGCSSDAPSARHDAGSDAPVEQDSPFNVDSDIVPEVPASPAEVPASLPDAAVVLDGAVDLAPNRVPDSNPVPDAEVTSQPEGGVALDTAASVAGDDFVSNVKITVHPQTKTILLVTWTQVVPADRTWIEFSFAGAEPMRSRGSEGTVAAHRDVILGVPEETLVDVRVVSRVGGTDYRTSIYQGTTGAIPAIMPRPTFVSYDAKLATPARWMFGAVEDSVGGCTDFTCYYNSLFWVYIMDRQGRIVWYWTDPTSDSSHAYPRLALDGEYIVVDYGRVGDTGVVKMTLDRAYYEWVPIPYVDDAVNVTADGSILYMSGGVLRELGRDGTARSIWRCPSEHMECYCNAVHWNAKDDTVLLSFPGPSIVVEVDRKTGDVVGQYGNLEGSYAFVPSGWLFQFPHSPTITPQGTLLVSTHLPEFPFGSPIGPNQHAFEEFEIDRAAATLTLKWSYSEAPEFAASKGFALRLAGGNTLVNYGSGGVIREVTADKKTVFEVKWDVPEGDDYFNKMVGENLLIDDLYALNGGGPK